MTRIESRADDAGVQRLKNENEAPATTRALTGIAPSARINEHPGARQYAEERAAEQTAAGKPPVERRKGDRRKHERDVWLDTRSKHDRRRRPEVVEDQETGEVRATGGIDIFT